MNITIDTDLLGRIHILFHCNIAGAKPTETVFKIPAPFQLRGAAMFTGECDLSAGVLTEAIPFPPTPIARRVACCVPGMVAGRCLFWGFKCSDYMMIRNELGCSQLDALELLREVPGTVRFFKYSSQQFMIMQHKTIRIVDQKYIFQLKQ